MTIWVQFLYVQNERWDNEKNRMVECDPFYMDELGSDGSWAYDWKFVPRNMNKIIREAKANLKGNRKGFKIFLTTNDYMEYTNKGAYFTYAPDLRAENVIYMDNL